MIHIYLSDLGSGKIQGVNSIGEPLKTRDVCSSNMSENVDWMPSFSLITGLISLLLELSKVSGKILSFHVSFHPGSPNCSEISMRNLSVHRLVSRRSLFWIIRKCFMVNHDRFEHQLSPEILAFAPLIERTHITNTNYRLSNEFVAWARMRSAYIQ
jgi:hypothetical protein